MTDDLATTALTFCREVLGWEDDLYHDPSGSPSITRRKDPDEWSIEHFCYSDLNAVMGAVKEWCSQHVDSFGLHCFNDSYAAVVNPKNYGCTIEIKSADPCQALMLACIEANRKLKA